MPEFKCRPRRDLLSRSAHCLASARGARLPSLDVADSLAPCSGSQRGSVPQLSRFFCHRRERSAFTGRHVRLRLVSLARHLCRSCDADRVGDKSTGAGMTT